MRGESEHFPAYSLERNKGYPSPHHQMALHGYGLSAIHRRWSYVQYLPWTDWRPSLRRQSDPEGMDRPLWACPEYHGIDECTCAEGGRPSD